MPSELSSETAVCVVGAGPVGLFTALLLAQAGITVEVFEAELGIKPSPRAVVHHPPVLNEFRKAKILDSVISAGVKNTTGIAWRAPGGKLLGRVTSDFSVLLGQPELAAIFLDRLERYPNAKVHFGYRFVRCEQGDDTVTVHLQHGAEKIFRRCRFLVGADGGHSPVRKSLGIPLEGFTWRDFRFVAANIRCPLQARSGWDVANFVVHPTDWAVVIKTGKDDLWRVATGEKWDEEMEKQEELREKYRRILPGVVNDDIEFISAAAYTAHQRCAQRFLDGNVVLVGDAAHLNNPIGGLGLTTGLLDAAHLGVALRQRLLEGRPYSVVQDYESQRREVFLSLTNRSSILQKKRLMSTEPEDIRERKEFFDFLNGPDNLDFKRELGEALMAMATTPA